MKKLTYSLLITSSLLCSSYASASFQCNTQIKQVLVYKNGNVNIVHSGRNDYTVICNLKQERDGVSVTTCAMWTSMLQHIKKNNGTAQFYYPGDGSCATLPTYSGSPAPVYIGDM